MRIYIGTSGFSYTPWRGSFYPEKLPAAKMLAYYAERLDAVEINNTFYRMPAPDMLAKWAAETPATFQFALKSPRRITHEKKLADVADSLTRLREAATTLGERLGPVLFQLPPFMKKDLPRLQAFVAQLPPGLRATMEFRHASWFAPDVYEALRARDVALCLAESEDLATPVEETSTWGYLRLRRQDYDDAALATWAERVKARAWQSAYVFFKHEDEGVGPKLAAKLRALVS
ncbi:MAG TPA: DUF72 domain-containing protein, partial [Polyangia bacterium]|jgi:uncharacterized protein YecE (DUF72 family)|nr:DUF72 domain-containing protein [Polyangia bacterium]